MALEQAGTTIDESLVRVADFREQGGYKAMQGLLEQEPLSRTPFLCPTTG